MWEDAIALFREYAGTGLILIWYIVSLVYLWINEKRKYIRILLLYMPAVLLLIYFNPLFAGLVYGVVGYEIYYRILWLLPVTAVIAYTCTCIYGRIAEKEAVQSETGRRGRKADLFALCAVGMIAVSGSFIYCSPLFSRAQNIYHVPDSVVHICDAIQVPGREVMAAFPLELVPYVRQYSSTTYMPYGREMTVERWNHHNSLSEAMEQEVIEMKELAALAREAGCHFCILPEKKKTTEDPEDYGWVCILKTDGYLVYRDPAIELIIP